MENTLHLFEELCGLVTDEFGRYIQASIVIQKGQIAAIQSSDKRLSIVLAGSCRYISAPPVKVKWMDREMTL